MEKRGNLSRLSYISHSWPKAEKLSHSLRFVRKGLPQQSMLIKIKILMLKFIIGSWEKKSFDKNLQIYAKSWKLFWTLDEAWWKCVRFSLVLWFRVLWELAVRDQSRNLSKLAKLVSQENQLYTTYHVMKIIFDYYMFHNYMESCRDIYLVHLVDTDMLFN